MQVHARGCVPLASNKRKVGYGWGRASTVRGAHARAAPAAVHALPSAWGEGRIGRHTSIRDEKKKKKDMTATGPQRVETPPTALHSTARGHAAAASCGAPPPAALSPSPPPNSPSFIGRRGRRRGGRRRGGRRTRGGAGTARGDLGLRGRAGGTDALQVVFHVDGRPVGGERAEEDQGTKKKNGGGTQVKKKKRGGRGGRVR